jgi:hypothetical protein
MKRFPSLLVAHPGHELRLHRWLELARPSLFVLTDGSGSAGHSRVPSTHAVLANAGARAGSVVAPFTDHEIYAAILHRDASAVASVTLRLAEAFVDSDFVVTDAWEGYNPAHDVCRIVGELATDHASRLAGRAIPLYEYTVIEPFEVSDDAGEIVIRLDEAAAERKIAAARAYSELRSDVDAMLAAEADRLRLEILRPARPPVTRGKPFYETRGEQQVAAGRYHVVLRYRDHVAPFLEALVETVRGTAPIPS